MNGSCSESEWGLLFYLIFKSPDPYYSKRYGDDLMTILEAHNIKHGIKEKTLFSIDHVSVDKNARIGLVGKNGSGKTTLLKILEGELEPDQGKIERHTSISLLPQLKESDGYKSGGEVTQDYIVKYMKKSSGLLIADEPTTNLDTIHVEWIEKELSNFQGAMILVSHDRSFLDKLCDTIWELDNEQLNVYTGNYSSYKKQKDEALERQQQEYENYRHKKAQLERAITKKKEKAERATKTPENKIGTPEETLKGARPYFAKKQKKLQKTSKAIETRLENLEKVDKVFEEPPLKMTLPEKDAINNKIILRFTDVQGSVPGKKLWDKTSFNIKSGDKVGIIGPNGAGKTTLLKKIMNQENGVQLHPAIKIGYFKQDLSTLDLASSILDNVKKTSIQEETVLRTVLARLHFRRDEVYKSVDILSGGERVKVALAKLLTSDINTLILDEPTNFLDIDAMEALENLVQSYEGTVIFVSHDRRFVENTATKIIEINNQELTFFDGTFKQLEDESSKEAHVNTTKQELMIIETKISEVLGKLSIEPSETLDREFQSLIKEKRKLEQIIEE